MKYENDKKSRKIVIWKCLFILLSIVGILGLFIPIILLKTETKMPLSHEKNYPLQKHLHAGHYYDNPAYLVSLGRVIDEYTEKMPDFLGWKNTNKELREIEEAKNIWWIINNYIERNELVSSNLKSLNTILLDSDIISCHVSGFTNESSYIQEVNTSVEAFPIKCQNTISWANTEYLNTSIKFKFKYQTADIDTVISSNQTYSKTLTKQVIAKNPSETISIDPYSKIKAETTFYYNTYESKAEVQFETYGKNLYLESSKYNSTYGGAVNLAIPVASENGIISELARDGYAGILTEKADSFSIFTADNPFDPEWFSINLPFNITFNDYETKTVFGEEQKI